MSRSITFAAVILSLTACQETRDTTRAVVSTVLPGPAIATLTCTSEPCPPVVYGFASTLQLAEIERSIAAIWTTNVTTFEGLVLHPQLLPPKVRLAIQLATRAGTETVATGVVTARQPRMAASRLFVADRR